MGQVGGGCIWGHGGAPTYMHALAHAHTQHVKHANKHDTHSANTSEKRKLSQELNMDEDGNSCQGQPKICKIATHSVPDPQPHLPDMTFHPDD